jgi:dCMP deaminase
MTSRPEITAYFLEMLKLVATRGTCVRRQVACIITDRKGHVLATGYNGVPSGFPHCTASSHCEGALDPAGDSRRCMAVHAEQNALIQCRDLPNAHFMFCSCTPCFTCAKMIANTNIKMVMCQEAYADRSGMQVLQQAGIWCMAMNDPIRDGSTTSDAGKPATEV